MNLWLWTALVIEGMAVVGTIGVVMTKRLGFAFAAGFNTMLLVTLIYLFTAPVFGFRQVIILVMVIIYLLHMNWLLIFQQQHTAVAKVDVYLSPGQKFGLPIFLTNIVGWGYCLPFYFAARRTDPFGWLDLAALGIYLIGTVIHFGSDYQKMRFKKRPDARGKLLDSGFWALCRHPNYFGDFLIYVAFGLIGGNLWGWISPLLNLLQYLFDAIPKNEQWAAQRYGKAWNTYVRRTRKFIPYFY